MDKNTHKVHKILNPMKINTFTVLHGKLEKWIQQPFSNLHLPQLGSVFSLHAAHSLIFYLQLIQISPFANVLPLHNFPM